MSIQKSYLQKKIEDYYYKAKIEYQAKNHHLVIGNLTAALDLLDSLALDNDQLYGDIFLILCRAYTNLKHYAKAHQICERGLAFFSTRDRFQVSIFHGQKVFIFMRQGKYQQAISWCFKALKMPFDHTDEGIEVRGTVLYNLATCYLNLFRYREAKTYYIKVFIFLKSHESSFLLGKILLGMGYVFHYQNELCYAERCYLLAKKALSENSDLISYGRLLHNLGEIYLHRGLEEKARDNFLASLEDEEVYKFDKYRVASSLRGIASTYLNTDMANVHIYSLKALNLLLKDLGVKFGFREEQELGMIFLIFSQWLYQNKSSDYRIYLSQAELIFEKYQLKAELEQVKHFRSQII